MTCTYKIEDLDEAKPYPWNIGYLKNIINKQSSNLLLDNLSQHVHMFSINEMGMFTKLLHLYFPLRGMLASGKDVHFEWRCTKYLQQEIISNSLEDDALHGRTMEEALQEAS